MARVFVAVEGTAQSRWEAGHYQKDLGWWVVEVRWWRCEYLHRVMEVGRLGIKRIEGGTGLSQEGLAQTLVRGTYVLLFCWLKLVGGVDNCGASLEGRHSFVLALGFAFPLWLRRLEWILVGCALLFRNGGAGLLKLENIVNTFPWSQVPMIRRALGVEIQLLGGLGGSIGMIVAQSECFAIAIRELRSETFSQLYLLDACHVPLLQHRIVVGHWKPSFEFFHFPSTN